MNDFRTYSELYHHGIKGQRWGKRNGPPYPLDEKQYSKREKVENNISKSGRVLTTKERSELKTWEDDYLKRKKIIKNVMIGLGIAALTVGAVAYYKHISKQTVDKILKKGTDIHTLIRDKDRLKDATYLFEAHDFLDRHQYKSRFSKLEDYVPILGKDGTVLSQKKIFKGYKLDANNVLTKSMKIASEKSASKAFADLYKKDKDFKSYIDNAYKAGGMDMTAFVQSGRLNFPEFKKANRILKNKSGNYSDDDLRKIYKIFNFNTMNSDEAGIRNRNAFFNALKQRGYSGMLDVNDSLYGGYHTNASNIIFDMDGLRLKAIEQLGSRDIQKSAMIDGFNFYRQYINSALLLGGGATASAAAISNNRKYKKRLNNLERGKK